MCFKYWKGDFIVKGTSKNPNLCVTRPNQNAHLPQVNSAFGLAASLDLEVFRGTLKVVIDKEFFKGVLKKNKKEENHAK